MGRKALTPLEKQLKQQLRDLEREDQRAYEILFEVYEPWVYSPELLAKLASLGVPMFVGPVHDKDKNADGTLKQPHRHCGAKYSNKKYLNTFYDELKELFGTGEAFGAPDSCLGVPRPQKVRGTFAGAVRYTKHLDNPEKYQYSEDPIGLCGLDPYEYLLQGSDEVSLIREIAKFIRDNCICYPGQFILQCTISDKPQYLSLYVRKKTYLINSIIRGELDLANLRRE